jgi:hypothetical protein
LHEGACVFDRALNEVAVHGDSLALTSTLSLYKNRKENELFSVLFLLSACGVDLVVMITARSPYQIYKAENANGSVSDFNSLLMEDFLPFKIAAAEEALLASLAIVETDEAQKAKYAVSVLHAASTYVSQLISYAPLSARSQTAKKIDIHYDAVVRTVMLFGTGADLFQSVKCMVLRNAPANQVSLKDLSDLEGALNTLEKEYRQRAKDAGEKVDMLRKVAPEAVVVASTTPVKTPVLSTSPMLSITVADGVAGEDANNNTLCTTTTAATTTASAAAGNSPGKRRTRSQSMDSAAMGGEADGAKSGGKAKMLKMEGAVDVADRASLSFNHSSGAGGSAVAGATSSPTSGRSGATKPRKTKALSVSGLVWGRLRGLTNNEKKAVNILQTMIQLLGHVYATKFNDLVPIFDLLEERLKAVQNIIDSERALYEAKEHQKPPEPFHDVDLADLRAALETSSHVFRTDEECRYELDEDLLHPIAHACLTVINHVEGFATAPLRAPTPEELEKKQQLRDAARVKREEATRRLLEKAEAKAELERKKEEEKQLVRRRLGDHGADDEEDLEEDTTLANPSAIGYVAYTSEPPLGSAALYEKALYVWSMLVSVPRALNLSQMNFATFLKGILCEDQDSNGLMEEVTKCLLDLTMEVVRVSSPSTPRITTRGKNWFDALVEFVGVASGNKKKRQQQRRQEPSTEEEEEEEEDEDDDDDDDYDDSEDGSDNNTSHSSSSSTGASTRGNANDKEAPGVNHAGEDEEAKDSKSTTDVDAAKSVEAADKEEVEEEGEMDLFTLELKATMDTITQLRSLATWGNIEVVDRLNLLQFCVQEAVGSEDVRAEADRLQKEKEDEVVNTDKKLKEIRDEAEKELKALLRTLPSLTGGPTKKRGRKAAASKSATKKSAAKPEEEEKDGADEHGDTGADDSDGGEGDEAAPPLRRQTAKEDYEAEREAILKAVDRKRREVYAQLYSRQDGNDDGAIIEPLGMDRYHRLYWRFPLERVVFVQAVPNVTSADFPALPEPEELRQRHNGIAHSSGLLLDEEEVELPSCPRGRAAAKLPMSEAVKGKEAPTAVAVQREWGVIPCEYLPTFVETLDRRGKREAPLRRALETLAPYLAQLEEFKEGRVTRSRANMFGYLNRLKVDFSY